MLWNQPSAMAMVLTLATLICGVLSTVSTLKQQSPSSNPVWLIDIVPLATNTGTDNATWVDVTAYGQSYIRAADNLPGQIQDGFVQTVYSPHKLLKNIRIYSREGEVLLSFGTRSTGTLSTITKKTQDQHWVITTTYWSPDELGFMLMQPISSQGGLLALGENSVVETEIRCPLVLDEPNTLYFFASSRTRVFKIWLVDSKFEWTDEIGDFFEYPSLLEVLEPQNAVIVHYFSNQVMSVINRGTLDIINSQNVEDVGSEYLLETGQLEHIFYTIVRTETDQAQLLKGQLRPDQTDMLTIKLRTQNLLFSKSSMAQLNSLAILILAPNHYATGTSSSYLGSVLFVSKLDLGAVSYQTNPAWSVQRITQTLSLKPDQDHGMGLYLSFMDAASNNMHFYYMLVDACLESDPTSSACSHCPSGYWRLSASFDPPRRCLKPADFPPVSGMDNSTSQIRPCQVSNCKECTYNLSSCTSCETSSGFYLDPNQSPPVCIPPEDFPKRFGLDTSKTRVVRCSDPSCLMCSLSAEKCTACDGRTGRYLSGSVCLGSTEMPIGQGPDLQTGRVVQCTSRGCLNCDTDSRVCSRCDLVSGWFLDNKLFRCKQIQDFSPNEGKDPATFRVVNCLQIGCSNCREDYR